MLAQHRNVWAYGAVVGALTVVGLAALFPFYYVVIMSFTAPSAFTTTQLSLFPSEWSLDSYRYLFAVRTFLRSMGISAFLAVVGTLLSLLVTSSLSYGLSRKRTPGRKPLMLAILLTILLSPGIIPPYLVVRELGLINSVWSLILPVLTSGWFVLLMNGFFESLPDSLEEAAVMDGCNEVRAWFSIVLPLSLPAMAAFGLFFAVGYWNTFFSAILYINDFEKWPLQLVLRNLFVEQSALGGGDVAAAMLVGGETIPLEAIKMAAVVCATVPVLLVYPFLQKHFAKGAMVGSVKG
ncbi:carbohydrate ABC transporter permease [Paenibacillus cymbidii]|uniref:carbohydrate ABC transporter permease n=1 Tax=Paenibacillus cymbidii TaxID=1639034 RepID=UPI0010802032|nr:carbohydrate ABC transporter permease [Paenibacillus cymbidii]